MRMTVAKKLIGSYILILALLGATVGINFYNLNRIQQQTDAILTDAMPINQASSGLITALMNEETGLRGYLVSGQEDYLESYDLGRQQVQDNLKILDSHVGKYPEMSNLINSAKTNISGLENFFASQIDLVKDGNIDSARTNVGGGKVLFDGFREINGEIEKQVASLTDNAKNNIISAKKTAEFAFFLVGIIAIVCTAIIGFLLNRSISGQIKVVSNVLQRVAAGDLTIDKLKSKSKDEIGVLANSLNEMVNNLREILTQVRDSSMHVASSSEELTASADQTTKATEQIASAAQQLASGAEEQLKSVTEAATAVNQMSLGIQQIATNSEEVTTLAQNASKASEDGVNTVHAVLGQMNEIHDTVQDLDSIIKKLGDHSQEIGNIVDMITDIASQTNLLALNAAIEAARAGEMGRGFAVVADEVRKLAEQSANSAQQIAKIIEEIQRQTENAVSSMQQGTEKVASGLIKTQQVDKAFQVINQSVSTVTGKVQEVSFAAQQVSVGSKQIVETIEIVSKAAESGASASQQTSAASEEQLATMEEVASSSQSLSRLAEDLRTALAKFKL